MAVASFCQMGVEHMHFPNLHAVAVDAASTPGAGMTVQLAENNSQSCVRDAVLWFLRKFNVQFYNVTRAFKAARLIMS